MIPCFDETAHYAGKPLAKMTRTDLVNALAYKVHELRQCYLVMTVEQQRDVALRMRDVEVILES